jgi:hypothetical protein
MEKIWKNYVHQVMNQELVDLIKKMTYFDTINS